MPLGAKQKNRTKRSKDLFVLLLTIFLCDLIINLKIGFVNHCDKKMRPSGDILFNQKIIAPVFLYPV